MNIFEGGDVDVQYPIYDDVYSLFENVSGFFKNVNVDDGAIQINQADHGDNVDDSHLLLKGALQSHESYVKIINAAGTELFRIDYTGKLIAPQDIVAPSLTTVINAAATNTSGLISITSELQMLETDLADVDTDIIALQASVVSVVNATAGNASNITSLGDDVEAVELVIGGAGVATNQPVDGSLVQRNNTAGTLFTKLNTEILEVDDAIALYGQSNIQWIPQELVNGELQNIPHAFVRLGRNQAQGAGPHAGDGIEIQGLPVSSGERNQIKLYADETNPSLDLQCNKSNTAPYIRCSDKHDVIQCEISEDGFVQRWVQDDVIHCDISESISLLKPGLRRYSLVLNTAWDDEADELILVLQYNSQQDEEENRFISCEVFLDETLLESGYTESMVYVDRIQKNVRKNESTKIRIVLKMELFDSESEIPIGTVLQLTIRNQLMIH